MSPEQATRGVLGGAPLSVDVYGPWLFPLGGSSFSIILLSVV